MNEENISEDLPRDQSQIPEDLDGTALAGSQSLAKHLEQPSRIDKPQDMHSGFKFNPNEEGDSGGPGQQ